mmetsp:Transcript_63603/g.132418  ORF Transcript_63603/g.132418 Transcript_63603/m.132418 type:complete len:337 (+) Transcript_63603:433-1443(+)
MLREDKIFPFFLRSGNSEQDQPNDNGPNAHLKALYANAYMEFYAWMQGTMRVVQMCPPIFNCIFCCTWELFIATSAMIVKNAFATTGLYPLNPSVAEEKPGASTMGVMFGGEISKDVVENPDAEEEDVGDLLMEAVHIQSTNLHVSKGAIIRKVILDFIMKPHIKESQKLHEEILAVKNAKKIAADVRRAEGVAVTRPTGNPSSLRGCYVTEELIQQVEQAERNKVLNEEDAKRRKEEGERKRVETRAKDSVVWAALTSRTVPGEELAAAQACNVPDLKAVIRVHGLKIPGKGNKPDLVPVVELLLKKRAVPPDDPAAADETEAAAMADASDEDDE